MNNRELVQAFASDPSSAGSGSNMHFSNYIAYSYSTQVARVFPDAEIKIAWVTNRKFSRTTSRHVGMIHTALAVTGYAVVESPRIPEKFGKALKMEAEANQKIKLRSPKWRVP